jgi:hypothetical protein
MSCSRKNAREPQRLPLYPHYLDIKDDDSTLRDVGNPLAAAAAPSVAREREDGRVPLAVVTGASTGIGYELAREAAKASYDLVIAAAANS